MTDKKETERLLFLADYFVNGNVPDSSDELRKVVLKNFGEDYIGQERVNDPGFFASVKRVFGLGGTHKEDIRLKDKIGEMPDDDLKKYLHRRHQDGFSDPAVNRFSKAINASLPLLPEACIGKNRRDLVLELWESVQKFSQTKFAKLYSEDDLSEALKEAVWHSKVPTVLSDFFEFAKEGWNNLSPKMAVEKMCDEVILPLMKTIRESDGSTLSVMTNLLQDHARTREWFAYSRTALEEAYADQARKNREEARSKSRTERLERGSIEGENDERNEMKGAKKSPYSSERKYSTHANRGESR